MDHKVKQYHHNNDIVLPKMKELLSSARKAVEAGSLPVGEYWKYRVRYLEIEKDLFDKKMAVYSVVSELEKLVGRPLIEIFKFDRQLFAELEESK